MPQKQKLGINVKHKTRSPLKLYFLLITLTGVIGSLITVGILIFTIAKKFLITDQEYIIAERYYELDQCNNPILKPTYVQTTTTSTVPPMMGETTTTATIAQPTPTEHYVEPTELEKEKCKKEKTEQLIASRNALFKNSIIGSSIWAILFLILLFTHYPKFMKSRREDQ